MMFARVAVIAVSMLQGATDGRLGLGLSVDGSVFTGDLETNPEFGGFGGTSFGATTHAEYGFTPSFGARASVSFSQCSGSDSPNLGPPAAFDDQAVSGDLAFIFRVSDSDVSPYLSAGGGLTRFVSGEETVGRGVGGLGIDFFLSPDWAVGSGVSYSLYSSDSVDGLDVGSSSDGEMSASLSLTHWFGGSEATQVVDPADFSRLESEFGELRAAVNSHPAPLYHQDVVLFETSSSVVSPSAEVVLDSIAELVAASTAKIILYGFADPRSGELYNTNLSLDRASAVRDYLVAAGVEKARISAVGLGEVGPNRVGSTIHPEDRRVEIFVFE